jgi:hypothetical protein
VAALLFAVVLAGDVFVSDPLPYLAPTSAPDVMVREQPVEKLVVETVVVEREVVVEKEVVAEAPSEAPAMESERVDAATPPPAPPEGKGEGELERVLQPSPLPTVAEEIEGEAPSALVLSTPEGEAQAEGPRAAREDRAEATPQPAEAVRPAEPASTPTAAAEIVPSTPLPLETAAPPVARSSRSESAVWRVAEIGLLALVIVLGVATLAARRRQQSG